MNAALQEEDFLAIIPPQEIQKEHKVQNRTLNAEEVYCHAIAIHFGNIPDKYLTPFIRNLNLLSNAWLTLKKQLLRFTTKEVSTMPHEVDVLPLYYAWLIEEARPIKNSLEYNHNLELVGPRHLFLE